MNGSPTHVSIEAVSHTYVRGSVVVQALERVSLEIGRGEFIAVIGPSGCGKSTLLRVIGGLVSPTSGSVSIDGESPLTAQKRKSLGYVFQDASLLPWRTVAQNVRLPLEVNRGRAARSPEDLIRLVGLERFSAFYPRELSGGMAQRVALARSLVHDPEVLLMDEPLGALDELTRAQMRYEVQDIWEASRKTVVFVTHSVPEAVILSDRVVVMTPTPGRVSGIVEVDLDRPRGESIESSPRFQALVNEVRALLRR